VIGPFCPVSIRVILRQWLRVVTRRTMVNTIVRLWPIMPLRAKVWAFMNDV